MSDLLPPWHLLSAFLVASFVLAVTPGPGVFYIVTRSVTQGRRSGLASVAGVALGNLCNAIGASLGLAALFAVSAIAFTIVKYAGALYLIYLGVKTLRAPKIDYVAAVLPSLALARIFRDGFLVAVLNPKTAVFFAAFLPQFMTPDAPAALQSSLLGACFVLIAIVTDGVYALAAGTFAPLFVRMKHVGTWARYAAGAAFIGMGLFAALSESREPRRR